VLRIVDLETRNVDVDRFRDVLGRAHHLDRVGDDVDRAAALHAGRLVGVHDVDGDADADFRAVAEPHEIHVHRQVLHRVELEIARNHPVLGAVDVELVDGGEEPARIDALLELGVIDRDRDRGLVVAVDHAGDAAGATLGTGGPLAGPRARRRLELLDGRHDANPLKRNGRHSGPSSPRHASRGVRGRGFARL
jgi:hypothetical protein